MCHCRSLAGTKSHFAGRAQFPLPHDDSLAYTKGGCAACPEPWGGMHNTQHERSARQCAESFGNGCSSTTTICMVNHTRDSAAGGFLTPQVPPTDPVLSLACSCLLVLAKSPPPHSRQPATGESQGSSMWSWRCPAPTEAVYTCGTETCGPGLADLQPAGRWVTAR